MFKIAKNKPEHLCKAYRCKNNRKNKHRFCSKHAHRQYKHNDPIAYLFHIKRSRARDRGHSWEITLEEWRVFVTETGYMEKRGRTASSASLDRIDPKKGYTIINLQILTVSENVKKHREDGPF